MRTIRKYLKDAYGIVHNRQADRLGTRWTLCEEGNKVIYAEAGLRVLDGDHEVTCLRCLALE